MPTFTVAMSTPALSSASRMASLMLSTVFWMLLTTPRFTPSLLALPMPRISILPCSLRRPTMQAILVVPMSRPTMISLLLGLAMAGTSVLGEGDDAAGHRGRVLDRDVRTPTRTPR